MKFRPKLYGIDLVVLWYFPQAPNGITTAVELSSEPNCNAWSVIKCAASVGVEQLVIMSISSWSLNTKLRPSVVNSKKASIPCFTWNITKIVYYIISWEIMVWHSLLEKNSYGIVSHSIQNGCTNLGLLQAINTCPVKDYQS